MPERSIGAVSKTVVPSRVPRVRIPVSPQRTEKAGETCFFCLNAQLSTKKWYLCKLNKIIMYIWENSLKK